MGEETEAKKKKRLQDYERKLKHFKESFQKSKKWSKNFQISSLLEDEMRFYAVYKAFQEIIEYSFDIVAMITKDMELRVGDDQTNLDQLKEAEILQTEEIEILKKGNHLRNVVIHRYNKIEEEEILKQILTIAPKLEKITGRFNEWVANNF